MILKLVGVGVILVCVAIVFDFIMDFSKFIISIINKFRKPRHDNNSVPFSAISEWCTLEQYKAKYGKDPENDAVVLYRYIDFRGLNLPWKIDFWKDLCEADKKSSRYTILVSDNFKLPFYISKQG